MAYKEIKHECTGSGKIGIGISSYEALRARVACSACGKWFKIRANRDNEATLPRHSRQESVEESVKDSPELREQVIAKAVWRTLVTEFQPGERVVYVGDGWGDKVVQGEKGTILRRSHLGYLVKFDKLWPGTNIHLEYCIIGPGLERIDE